MEQRWFRERDAAEFLDVSVGLLRRWRGADEGPAYVRFGKRGGVRYERVALERFIREREVAR